MTTAQSHGPKRIEVMVRNMDALFNNLDPAPFREKDLNTEAEEFIVTTAREFAPDVSLVLRIHLQEAPAADAVEMVGQAVRNYFRYRAESTVQDFRRMMREARLSLTIGLAFLFVCLLISAYLIPRDSGPFLSLVRESLTIAGWVAMWQPMQTYLYDWWPIRRRRRVYTRLSTVPVEVVKDATILGTSVGAMADATKASLRSTTSPR